MKDKKTLKLLKVASVVFMVMLLVLIIALWGRNHSMPYYLNDKGKIADKVMLAAKLLIMLFVLYKSTSERKYFITILAFIQAAGIFWIRFMGPEVTDSEYLKIDRLSITVCALILLCAVFINIYIYSEENINFVWILVSSLGFMGAVLSYDLVWMDFFLALAFLGLYMWIKEGRYIILGLGIVSEIFVTVSCIYASQKIQVLSLQSIIVCKAMSVEGALYPAVIMLIAACVLLLCGVWIFIKKNADTSIKLYISSVSALSGLYLFIRFIPVYSGDTIGTVVKFAGAVIFLLMSLCLNIVKEWKQAVMVLSMACPAGLAALSGVGLPISTWYVIMIIIIYIPILIMLYLNEDSGRYLYVHIVSVFCLILTPIQVISYRMSAFKLYLKMENKVWLIIMAVSYVVFIVGLVRWMNKFANDTEEHTKNGRGILSAATMILAAAIVFMPFAVKNWIYPMMSQTEIMISNISASKIPLREIIVMSVMTVITFFVPVLVLKIYNMKKRRTES